MLPTLTAIGDNVIFAPDRAAIVPDHNNWSIGLSSINATDTISLPVDQPLKVGANARLVLNSASISANSLSEADLSDDAYAEFRTSGDFNGTTIGGLGHASLLSIQSLGANSGVGTIAATRGDSNIVELDAGTTLTFDRVLDLPGTAAPPVSLTTSSKDVVFADGAPVDVPKNNNWWIRAQDTVTFPDDSPVNLSDGAPLAVTSDNSIDQLEIGALGDGSSLSVAATSSISDLGTAAAERAA